MAQYYLKHDIDAFSDPKVIKLRMLHGFEAYGIYWRILEMLFSEPEYAMKYKGTTFQLIEFETRTTLNVKEVIDTCVEIELLEIDSTGEFFYSASLNRRMKALDKYRQEQSERGRKGAEARWGTNDTSIAEAEDNDSDTVTSGNNGNGESMTSAINDNSGTMASAIDSNATAMAKNGNKIILDKTRLDDTKLDDITHTISTERSNDRSMEEVFIEMPLNDKSVHLVTTEDLKRYRELYQAVNVEQELRAMVGWLEANPTKRKTKRGVKAFITNWLIRAQDKGGANKNKNQWRTPAQSERERIKDPSEYDHPTNANAYARAWFEKQQALAAQGGEDHA